MSAVLVYDFQPGGGWKGGLVPDLSGSGNDGVCHGFVDCGVDGARFDGVSSRIDIGVGALGISSFTLETVTKVNSITAGSRLLARGLNQILWKYNFNGQTQLILKVGAVQYGWFSSTVNTFPNNVEVYLAVSYEATTGDYNFYAQGLLNGSGNIGVTGAVDDTEATYVGGFTTATHSLDGSMKFVKVSPYALTETQVKNNWNNIAKLVIFNEPMFNQLPDNRSYTAGMWLENWQVASGTFTVKEDSTGTYIECSGNGVIQYKGVDFSMYHENGFIKRIVGDISSDQDKTVTVATNVAWANNELSVTLTTGQKLYEMVIQAGEEQ